MCDKKSYTISTTSCQLNKHYWLMCSGVCLNISLVEPTCHQMLLCYVSTSSCLDLSYFSQNVLTCGIQIVVYYKVVNNKPSVCIFVGTDSFKISAIKSMKAHENGIFAWKWWSSNPVVGTRNSPRSLFLFGDCKSLYYKKYKKE